ncbi:hypothetical protein C8J57DRAFT_1214745 [Mycena rebaudengoi]|nr:hypothetical protein C8J57DRAFT_1214745 [Mycena rebaudengoi]
MLPMQGLPRLYPARAPWQAELRFSFTGYPTYPLQQAKLATPDDFVLGQYSLDQPGGHLRTRRTSGPKLHKTQEVLETGWFSPTGKAHVSCPSTRGRPMNSVVLRRNASWASYPASLRRTCSTWAIGAWRTVTAWPQGHPFTEFDLRLEHGDAGLRVRAWRDIRSKGDNGEDPANSMHRILLMLWEPTNSIKVCTHTGGTSTPIQLTVLVPLFKGLNMSQPDSNIEKNPVLQDAMDWGSCAQLLAGIQWEKKIILRSVKCRKGVNEGGGWLPMLSSLMY